MSAARSERGSNVVEFALVFSFVVLPLMFGIVQYGYQFWSLQTADAAAREAARSLSVGTTWACTRTAALAAVDLPALSGPQAPAVTMAYPAGTPPKIGDVVEVRVQFSSLDIGFLPVPARGVIDRTARARVENVPSTPLAC